MAEKIGQGSPSAVPCALQRYLSHGHNAQSLATLSHSECQKEFQHWVTCTHAAGTASLLNISPKEHLMCPLLWCRTSFKDLASVINHVSSCPWLTDAWYWCPVCCRPERFTTTEATSTATPQAVDLGKETKYNRAVSFFKNLGCRREGRSRASLFPAGSTTVNTTVEYPNTNAYSGYQIIELGDTSRSPVELDSGMVYELGDEVQCVTPEFSTVNHTPYTSSTRSPDSLEGESLAVSPPYSFPIVASESPAVGVDAQTEARPCSIGIHNVGNRALSSPVSLTRGSPILYGKDAGRSPVDLWQLDIPKTNSSPSQSTPHLQGNHQIRIGGILRSRSSSPTPVHEVEGSPSKQEPDTTQAQVGDLCDGVRAMSNEWIQRLALDTETSQLNLEQYAVAQFDLGVGALRSLFRGTIPSKFQDIFALMHVAIASAYIVREDDLAYSWNTFLESACQWQYCLFDVIEKRTFVKVMRRMCQPPVSTTSPTLPGFADNDDFLPAERATLVRLIRHLSSTGIGAAIREEGDQAQQHCTIDNEQSILLGVLRSDVIVKGCMDLLDNYGHAVIVEDLTNRQINSSWYIEQHVPGLEILDSNIVGRLQECEGLEAFRGVVNETRNLLRRGLLHSARDVEIMLVWLGKSYSKSPRLLRRYLDVVKYLCDMVMKDCGQQWRFAFYETILVTVLATASESSRSQVHALQNSPVTTSGNLDGRHDAGTPTANAAMPPVELDAFSSLSSNSLLTSSAPSDDLSYCPCESCKSSFKGKSQKTNLTRHLKTVLHHKQNVPLKCQFCQKNISSRTDNFQQHMRNIHNVDSPLKKQRTHDRGESRDSGD